MPKIKTYKGAAKRLWKTRTGKVMKRKAGQGHFNSREPGKVVRAKRSDTQLSKTHATNAKRLIPYS